MRMRHAAVVAGLALGLMSGAANAAYIIDIEQLGNNVVATESGSIALTGLTFQFNHPQRLAIFSSIAYLALGAKIPVIGGNNYDEYSGLSGPTSFGNGDVTDPSSSSGSAAGVLGQSGLGGLILVPTGYKSGTDLGVSVDTFSNTTLAALGLTPGSSFEFTNSAQGSESFPNLVINVENVSAVPLPASAPMFGAALLVLGAFGYGVKRKKAAAA